jgi:short-subunit dehydrogenase
MKKVIIIGASSGIGKSLALLYAKKGYLVGICGRRENNLEYVAKKYPGKVFYTVFDINETNNNPKKLNELIGKIGGMDICIHCAGVGEINDDLNFETENRTITTNVTGFTSVIGHIYKFFAAQESGQLAIISSIAGIRGNRSAPAYYASKAFQSNYLEGLRQKANHSKLPITIADIRPGFVDTAMAQGQDKFWVCTPEKAAIQICKAITSKKEVVYISKRWILIAMLLKVVPNFFYKNL